MNHDSDRNDWLMTDPDTVKRMVRRRDGTPGAVPDDASEDAGAPRIRDADDPDEGLVEVGWETFFDRLDERDLAVAVRVTDGDLSVEVVPRDEDEGGDDDREPPAAVQQTLEGRHPTTDDPPETHHEAAREDANPDMHRDEPPES